MTIASRIARFMILFLESDFSYSSKSIGKIGGICFLSLCDEENKGIVSSLGWSASGRVGMQKALSAA